METSPMRQHGPWKILKTHAIYADPWVRLRKDEVLRPDGKPGTYTVVDLKPGVSVLAIDEHQHVYLTEEFHYGVGRITIELVSGGREEGEDPLETAQRELREEIGIEAAQWTSLGSTDPFTSNIVSPTELYLAEQLRFVDRAPEGTEVIRRVRMPLAEAVRMVLDSRITHGPSCIALLKTWIRYGGGASSALAL